MVSLAAKQTFVEEIRSSGHITSPRLLEAFSRVPREVFLGPPPWRVAARIPGERQHRIIETTDPSEIYHDVVVFLDYDRSITNGNPATIAQFIEALALRPGNSVFHLGCGSGYFTAVMAEMVGPTGEITAVEVDVDLAARARENLGVYRNVEVLCGDGASVDTGPCDAILINAGITHLKPDWFDSLNPDGHLVAPLTLDANIRRAGNGMVLEVTKQTSGFAARFLPSGVVIYSCSSLRSPAAAAHLDEAMTSGRLNYVRSLRRDPHTPDASCVLHSPGICLSTRLPQVD